MHRKPPLGARYGLRRGSVPDSHQTWSTEHGQPAKPRPRHAWSRRSRPGLDQAHPEARSPLLPDPATDRSVESRPPPQGREPRACFPLRADPVSPRGSRAGVPSCHPPSSLKSPGRGPCRPSNLFPNGLEVHRQFSRRCPAVRASAVDRPRTRCYVPATFRGSECPSSDPNTIASSAARSSTT